jgi:hypothetical protein
MALKLVKATTENRMFDALKKEWDAQLSLDGAPPPDFYEPMMRHAETIIYERCYDSKYGIFIVTEHNGRDEVLVNHGFAHISHKLPRTSDSTLKILWNLIAPRYQYSLDEVQIARIMTTFVGGAFDLSRSHMPAQKIQIYLGNSIDREFAVMAAAFLERMGEQIAFAIKGSWLHIDGTG